MDELIRELSAKTGLPADQARKAAEVVVNFLKERLPAPIASQLDSVLKGTGAMPNIGGIADKIGGVFGGKS